MSRRVGGLLFLKVDGVQYQAKGEFTYSLLKFKREMVVGADGVHGYKEMPVAPFIEGAITDSDDLGIDDILNISDSTVTIQLANGKTISLEHAAYVADGETKSEEGEIQFRVEGTDGAEIPASA